VREYDALWNTYTGGDSADQLDSTTSYDDSMGGEVFWDNWMDSSLIWYTPKVDWAPSDTINSDDFNAIEVNTSTILTFLESIQYPMPELTTVTNRTQASIDFLTGINRIEQNLEAIHSNFVHPNGYLGSKTWTSGKGFTDADASRLERNIMQLFEYGQLVVDSFRYCGTFYCGEGWGRL
jgi:hypothetical protein